MATKGIGPYIDLIQYIYEEKNPIIISDLIKQEFQIRITIHQIADYLDINRQEDFEKESFIQFYKM